jgi:phage tail protein X
MLSRYTTNLEIEKTDKGVQYYTTILPSPITPDAFQFKVVTQDGDRFDSLATRYYKDASKWWIIAKANGYVNGTVFIPGGIELIIPSAGLL